MSVWERVKEELETERERYWRTRYGKVGALFIILGMFKFGPIILRAVMPYLQHLNPHYIFVAILISTFLAVSAFFNGLVFVLSKLKLPYFERYRINPNTPWPWEETDPQKVKQWNRLIRYNLLHGGFKYLILLPTFAFLSTSVRNMPIIMDMSMCPTSLQMLPQLLIMFMVEDAFNFFIHWAFHHPVLYRFHKEHHEYKYPIPLAAWHFHYVEFFFLQILSGNAYLNAAVAYGPLHLGTLMVWFIFRFFNNNLTHSGYTFPWTPTALIPFALNDEFHDFHHTHNVGNYGLYLRLWDSVFGQTQAFREFKAKQKALTPKSN